MRAAGLSDSEKQVRSDFLAGGRTDFTVGDPDVDRVTSGASWGPERTVRAEFLAKLIGEAGERRAPLRVVGARVTGPLELEYLELGFSLSFGHCYFEHRIDLHDTRLRRLNLFRSRLAGLYAVSAHVEGSVVLTRAQVEGQTRLSDAAIGGALLAEEAIFRHGADADVALRAERMRVSGNIMLTGSTVEGTSTLRDARTDGILNLENARLLAPGDVALDAARIQVGSDVFGDSLYTEGVLRFSGARTAGLLRLADAKLNNPGGIALEVYRADIGADLQCYRGFEADGQVQITGTRVAGHLRFDEAILRGDGRDALDARYADIGGAARCRGMHAYGAVRFASARVANDLDFRYAVLAAAQAAGSGGGVGSAGAAAASAAANTGAAGSAAATTTAVAGSAAAANTAPTVLAPAAAPTVAAGHSPAAVPNILFLGHLRAAELTLRFAAAPEGGIHLTNAQVGVLNDDPATWPPHLALDGFAYERIAEPGGVARRIRWLRRENGGYRPGPYEHLAAVYRRQGLDGEARRVLLAKQRARRRTLPIAARPWGFVQDAAVGYGYRPERALGWLAALLITGTLVFGWHHPVASSADKAPPFNALIYSLDLLLPVINFGQGRAYVATGGYQWVAYLLTAAGWILATTIAAGVARAVNRA